MAAENSLDVDCRSPRASCYHVPRQQGLLAWMAGGEIVENVQTGADTLACGDPWTIFVVNVQRHIRPIQTYSTAVICNNGDMGSHDVQRCPAPKLPARIEPTNSDGMRSRYMILSRGTGVLQVHGLQQHC